MKAGWLAIAAVAFVVAACQGNVQVAAVAAVGAEDVPHMRALAEETPFKFEAGGAQQPPAPPAPEGGKQGKEGEPGQPGKEVKPGDKKEHWIGQQWNCWPGSMWWPQCAMGGGWACYPGSWKWPQCRFSYGCNPYTFWYPRCLYW